MLSIIELRYGIVTCCLVRVMSCDVQFGLGGVELGGVSVL
jgi:hypothetical protein